MQTEEIRNMVTGRAVEALRRGAATYIERDPPYSLLRWAVHVWEPGPLSWPWHGSYTLTFDTRREAREALRRISEAASRR